MGITTLLHLLAWHMRSAMGITALLHCLLRISACVGVQDIQQRASRPSYTCSLGIPACVGVQDSQQRASRPSYTCLLGISACVGMLCSVMGISALLHLPALHLGPRARRSAMGIMAPPPLTCLASRPVLVCGVQQWASRPSSTSLLVISACAGVRCSAKGITALLHLLAGISGAAAPLYGDEAYVRASLSDDKLCCWLPLGPARLLLEWCSLVHPLSAAGWAELSWLHPLHILRCFAGAFVSLWCCRFCSVLSRAATARALLRCA